MLVTGFLAVVASAVNSAHSDASFFLPFMPPFQTNSGTNISRSGDFSVEDDDDRHTDRSHNPLRECEHRVIKATVVLCIMAENVVIDTQLVL